MMNDNVESENPVGPASAIQAIDKKSVHRICSGQVVLTLATAVKELVENSLDAGATIIEVRLKEYGSELLEVIDNGCGVEEKNFEGLTLKHHTSKLRDFGDLVSVETFGFRGEALSSLCALSNLIVTTCHESSSIGTKLELDYNGKITSRQPCARQKGTTVSLGQLFHTLPVRHREFQRNLKKEFSKMVHVLNGYCIISTSVRITCTNQVGKGKKNIIASTNGNDNIKENITNIFGPKQVQSLLVFEQVLPSDTVCSEYNIKIPENLLFSVTGFISSSEHGKGRGVSDRQFTYINRRPFDHTKLSRVVNEVYHSYNRHQYPFVVLDITLDKESVDVNVTPDKRQVFISSEKILLAVVKTSLMKMFEPISSVFQVNQGQGKSGASLLSSFTRTPTGGRDSIQSDIRRCDSDPGSAPKKSLTSSLAGLKRSFSSAFDRSDSSPASTRETQPPKQRRLDTFIKRSQRSDEEASSPPLFTAKENTDPEGSNVSRSGLELDKGEDQTHNKTQLVTSQSSSGTDSCQQDSEPASSSQNTSEYDDDITVTSAEGSPKISPCHDVTLSDFCCGCDNETVIKTTATEDCEKESTQPMISNQERSESLSAPDDAIPSKDIERKDETVAILEYDQAEEVARKSRTISFSMAGLKNSINKKKRKKEDDVKFRSFRARISPADNQAAEQELQKEIKKDMFPSMEILGQFNLGFIITKHGSDLFIVDQHATDEKYNFEMLQRHTVIHSQKLIQPQSLELTAANSTVLIDNMEIFRTNGFEFDINEEAPITSRVRLASMPVSKNWTFGKDDIEELIFMLKDSPGVLCRPSRVRMMFASRACRKSIMVGTALSVGEMRKVVNHMAEIDQPWNCPHGRPTMRHLINLDCLQDLGQQS